MRIDVSGNQIQSVPAEIAQQTTVQNFSLMGNMLSTIPDSIYSMESLKILDLSNNQICAIFPAIGNAKLLIEFKCSGNAI